MADGNVRITASADTVQAQKDLAKLTREIQKQQIKVQTLKNEYESLQKAKESALYAESGGAGNQLEQSKAKIDGIVSSISKYKEALSDLDEKLSANAELIDQKKIALTDQKKLYDEVNNKISQYSERLQSIAGIDVERVYGSGTDKFVQKKLKELNITQEEYGVLKNLVSQRAELYQNLKASQSEYEKELSSQQGLLNVRSQIEKKIYNGNVAIENERTGIEMITAALQKQSPEQERINKKLDEAQAKLESLSATYNDIKGPELAGAEEPSIDEKISNYFTEQEIKKSAEQDIKEASGETDTFASKLSSLWAAIKNGASDSAQRLKDDFSNAFGNTKEEADEAVSETTNNVKTSSKGLLTVFKFVFKSIGSYIGSAGKLLVFPFTKLAKKMSTFKKRLITAILQGLIFRQIRTSLSKMVQMYGELINTNTEVAASFSTVRGTAIAAFQPFMAVIVPIIKTVCNWIVILIRYISTLMSLFFGLSAASKKAAASLYKQSQAASAGGSANDKFLASWDTLQQVQQSGGGGGGASITPDFNVDDVSTKLDWLKDKLALKDWYGIGMEIQKRLNDVLWNIDSWIKEKFYPKITEIGTNIGNLFNGLADGLDPLALGQTIGDFLNSAVDSAFNFLTTFKFENAGQKLGDTLCRIIQNIDFKKISQTLSKAISGILEFGTGFLSGINWETVGQKIGDFIAGIDFKTLAKNIVKGIFTAIDALFNLGTGITENSPTITDILQQIIDGFAEGLSEVDFEKLSKDFWYFVGAALGKAVSDLWNFIKAPFEFEISSWASDASTDAEDIGQGILDGIIKPLIDIYNWVKTNIVEPFISAFKKNFGIASPSTVMFGLGQFVSDGVLNGILDPLKDIYNWIKTNIFNPIYDKFCELFGIDNGESSKMKEAGQAISSGLKSGIESGIQAIKDVINTIISAIETALNWIISNVNSISFNVPNMKIFGNLAGTKVGFNLQSVSIPRLAQGTVVNPGHEFSAILGDNRYEKEVVSPLSTMKQAFVEALAQSGYNKQGNIVLEIDGQTFARITNPYMQKETDRIGIKAVGGIA